MYIEKSISPSNMNIEFNANPVFGNEKMYSQVLKFRHRGN